MFAKRVYTLIAPSHFFESVDQSSYRSLLLTVRAVGAQALATVI